MNNEMAVTIDGARFLGRAILRQDTSPTGTFRLAEVVSREDVAALHATLELLAFLRAAGPSFGMRAAEAAELETTLETLVAVRTQLDDPAENWKGSPEERAAASRERERIYDAGMDHGEEDGFREGYRAALAELIDHMTTEPGRVRVYSPDDIRRYATVRGVTLEGDTDGE